MVLSQVADGVRSGHQVHHRTQGMSRLRLAINFAGQAERLIGQSVYSWKKSGVRRVCVVLVTSSVVDPSNVEEANQATD